MKFYGNINQTEQKSRRISRYISSVSNFWESNVTIVIRDLNHEHFRQTYVYISLHCYALYNLIYRYTLRTIENSILHNYYSIFIHAPQRIHQSHIPNNGFHQSINTSTQLCTGESVYLVRAVLRLCLN